MPKHQRGGPPGGRRHRPLIAALMLHCAQPARVWAAPTARFDDVPPREPSAAAAAPAPPEAPSRPGPRPDGVARANESWATRAARGLLERAQEARARGDSASALRWLTEAIRMDPTYGPGYFALGELREALGDGAEAERVYELAMRLPGATGEALARRGQLRFRSGDRLGASADLEASLSVEPDRLERLDLLGRWYLEARQWAPGLAVWRRVLALKERAGAPDAELQGLRTRVRALILLAGETDPVSSGARDQPGWVRGAFAQIAARLPEPVR